jgi:hypothetical protein
MRRLSTFITGMLAGAIVLYTALNFHVIRANDGMHLVPKVQSRLGETYVDIRTFRPRDWIDHPAVAEALVRADRQDLLQTAANDALRNGLEQLLPPAGGTR